MNVDNRLMYRLLEEHARLMAASCGLSNDHLFACMLVTHEASGGDLPPWLGLGLDGYVAMIERHFPGMPVSLPAGRVRHAGRVEVRAGMHRLLLAHRADVDVSEGWMAAIVAAGYMGSHHLWQDLGLWSRVDLTGLMRANFPILAVRNTHEEKWKRFLYEQLCQQAGICACRAPSCDVCIDLVNPLGPPG